MCSSAAGWGESRPGASPYRAHGNDRARSAMTLELAQIVAGWPFAASLALAATVRTVLAARQRTVLNEALHELRRPLPALALAAPGGDSAPARIDPARIDLSLGMATAALERLDREINGAPAAPEWRRLAAEELLREAIARWRPRAAAAGRTLELRWRAAGAVLAGDRVAIAQAVDN